MKPTIFVGCSHVTEHLATAMKKELGAVANFIVFPHGGDKFWQFDFFSGTNKPDIAIYILETSSLGSDVKNEMQPSDQQQFYNAGVLLGKMGKGNAYFLVPEAAPDMQWILVDKKFKKIIYNPCEKFPKKMLLPFCQELRERLKDLQYILDNDLKDLPPATQRVALSMDKYWEFTFLNDLLAPQVKYIKQYYAGLDNNQLEKQFKENPGDNTPAWLSDKMNDYHYLVNRFNHHLTNDFLNAVRSKKLKNKPALLKKCSKELALIIDRLFGWQLGCKITTLGETFEFVRDMMVKLAQKTLDFMVSYVQKLAFNFALIKLGMPPKYKRIALNSTASIIEDIHTWIERMQGKDVQGDFSLN